jgi:PRC-barrel domain
MSERLRAASLGLALLFCFGVPHAHTQALDGRLVIAQSPHQAHDKMADDKRMPAEEKMSRRFPQPIKVGDLLGLAVLDDYDLTIGYVRHVVRTPEGQIRLIITQGGWLGPWFGIGARLVSVPIEVVVILGRQLAAFDMPRQEFATTPTWSGSDSPIPPDETIKIAIARR